MRQFTFAVSSCLALLGGGLAVCGIISEFYKMLFVGMVLVFTAGVFATLYLGSRGVPR